MTMLSASSWLDWQESTWRSWLEEQTEVRKTVFLTDPDEMIGAYNRERSSARDYYGRELLELLQNADDAGAEIERNNRVLVELADKSLFVANTGQPFSPTGVKSLMVSDNSPKQLSRTRFIGYKGLGFRSVLGWASKIVILSGKLSIVFTEDRAIGIGKSLCSKNEQARRRVEEFLKVTGAFPIPVLAFPAWSGDELASDYELRTVVERAEALSKEGFDTVVGFVLKEPAKAAVESQINSLGKEILLFSNFLEKAEIKSYTRKVVWEAARDGKEIVVESSTEGVSLWRVFDEHGRIPAEYIGPGQSKEMGYEVKIAVPESDISQERLFVYFPTEVLFPFPVFAHATFELVGNRQHLIESEINRFVCQKLAEKMAEVAEKSTAPESPWKAFSIIAPRGQIDPVLSKLGLLHMLNEKCALKKIAPVRRNKFITPTCAKTIEGNFDSLLVGDEFADLCLRTEDDNLREQLDALGAEPIKQTELVERLNKISPTLTIEKRADIIYLLVENNLLGDEQVPALLVDEEGETIAPDTPVFLPPEGQAFSIPKWVPIRFLNSGLTRTLQGKFSSVRIRDLTTKLKAFGVQEYNLASIVSAITAEANRQAQANPKDELQIRQQMLNAIWSAYQTSRLEQPASLFDRVTFIVPNRKGEFKPSTSLCFGHEYRNGHLMEALLGSFAPASFIAGPQQLGLPCEDEEIEPFLRWLGIEDMPREKEAKGLRNPEYLNFILSSLNYPAKFEEVYLEIPSQVHNNYPRIERVQTFDRLEEILGRANPLAIIAWLVKDHRLESLRLEGDKNARLSVLPPYKQYRRYLDDQTIPSYPVWLLEHTAWLPTVSGTKPPAKCSMARGLPKELSKIIGVPAIDYEYPLFKSLAIDRIAIRNALASTGVVAELDDLPWHMFYEILIELPRIDPDGNLARSLYRTFVSREEHGASPQSELREKFFQEGKMFGRFGSEYGYFPINQLYYLDNLTLPEHIARFFSLLELDRRRGAAKVEKLFNVKPLTAEKIQAAIRVTELSEHPSAEAFQHEIERLKPYVYALRTREDSDRSELAPLRRLKVTLCRSVRADIESNGRKESIGLEEGDSLYDGNTAYLVAEPTQYDRAILSDVLIADAVGEIMSNVLRVDLNNEVARLASCPLERRLALLDRITGGAGAARLNEASEAMQSSIIEEEPPIYGVTPTHFEEKLVATVEQPEYASQEEGYTVLPPSEVGPVTVTQKDFTPTVTGERTKLTFVISQNPIPSKRRRLVNPDRAENLAIQFEKEQGRIPLKVSQLKGTQAYGCDLLSFKSEDERKVFEIHPDISAVSRFIEVKGRVSEKGSITLKDNELRAAQTYRDRYYVYRIYEDEDNRGSFELIELRDPLGSEKEAVKIIYEVNPFRAVRSIWWDVQEKPSNSDLGSTD